MCGIAGFTMFRSGPADPDAVLRDMARTLEKRGPDGEGFHRDGAVALGHRRLSIIDLAGGAQPMATADGRYAVTYNGEIYNYLELRAGLERDGAAFRTASDTEVLLQDWARKGPAALEDFSGMFAFALWDREARTLHLARDRMGIKPLYWTQAAGELVFASELKALLCHPGVARKLDLLSVSKYLTYGYIPAPHTIFEGVFKLEPGTRLEFDGSVARQASYWDIPLRDRPVSSRSLDECAADLRVVLRDAVRQHLRADVPVGVFLSGGLDSSLVAALAAAESSRPIRTFSIGFEEASYDESPFAREVARACGTEHREEVLSLRRALDLLPGVLERMDEPLADASILPTSLLAQFAAREVKVVLGGDGGDELFAGYPAFQAHRLVERLSFLPMAWRDALTRAARHIPVSHRYASLEFLAQQFFKGAGISPEVRLLIWLGCCGNEQRNRLLSPDAREALRRRDPFEDVHRYVRQSGLIGGFERILYLAAKLYLQDDILVKVDRASMAHSLEVRVPYLDPAVVEYAAGLPSEYKLRGFTTKYVLKRAARGLVPERIIRRRKAGFMMPVAAWLQRDLRPRVEELCAPDRLARDGLFDPKTVRELLDEHFTDRRDHRKVIWALFAFQHWRQQYLS